MKIFLWALRHYARLVDGLCEWLGRSVAWLTTGLVLVTCLAAGMRYAGHASTAVQELEWHLFALIFLLGAGYTLRHDRHIRVDILYGRLGPRGRAVVNLIGVAVFLLPISILIIVYGIKFAQLSWGPMYPTWLGEPSSEPGGLPGRGFLKATIPLGFALLVLQGLALAAKSLLTLLEPAGESLPEEEQAA